MEGNLVILNRYKYWIDALKAAFLQEKWIINKMVKKEREIVFGNWPYHETLTDHKSKVENSSFSTIFSKYEKNEIVEQRYSRTYRPLWLT